jgi:integrase
MAWMITRDTTMPKVLLTDRAVAGYAPRKRTKYYDTKARGLVLRVGESGQKVFYFTYAREPREVWKKLEPNWPALSLADARAQAYALRALVEQGRDPVEDERRAAALAEEQAKLEAEAAELRRQAEAAALTFAGMADVYLTFAKGKKRTWREDELKLQRYLIPAWGARPLVDITRADVHQLLDQLAARGLTVGVNRVQALITRVFSVALDRGYVPAHPAMRIEKRFKEQPRDVVLSDDQLRALWVALDDAEATAADAIRVRLLTGQRGGEVAGMTWTEVDLSARTWTMGGTRTKNGDPHVVPLSPTVAAVLTRRLSARHEHESAVFPGYRLDGHAHRTLGAVHGAGYTWIDLRRTMTTRLAELGTPAEVLEALLNHRPTRVLGRHYNRAAYLAEKRAALEAWDEEVQRIITGRPRAAEAGAVLPFRSRRRDRA